MKYESIADIYSAHNKIRERFFAVAKGVTNEEAEVLLDGEKWSIRQIVEHVSIVEFNMMRICNKLTAIARAAGKPWDGSFALSPEFSARIGACVDMKLEAPERVHPSGDVSIADALEQLDGTTGSIERLRADLESFDGSEQTFPHPFFGELTAAEWLVVRGGHEHRHTAQIEKLLERIRN